MSIPFSDRIRDVPRSFIREILKDALQPGTISFAGGLPNPDLFPVEALKQASDRAYQEYGKQLLQYSESEGFLPLREWIAKRYQRYGLDIDVSRIQITSGSQQGLDLLGKIFLNDGDGLVIEEPGYLGAIQALSLYKPNFCPVTVTDAGMDCEGLESILRSKPVKLIYTVPNFQNPSGITYPNDNRQDIANIVKQHNCLLIEDNPYGELRFDGEHQTSFANLLPDQTILLGSFSKTIVPGFRLGWIVVPTDLTEKVIIAKQAADLHTNQLVQCSVYQYLLHNDIDQHIEKIISVYRQQKDAMIAAMQEYFPQHADFTKPDGGMFLWADLPNNQSAVEVFHAAAKEKVIFVPGDPFYINRRNTNTMRLNFTCVDVETIQAGIQRLGKILHDQHA